MSSGTRRVCTLVLVVVLVLSAGGGQVYGNSAACWSPLWLTAVGAAGGALLVPVMLFLGDTLALPLTLPGNTAYQTTTQALTDGSLVDTILLGSAIGTGIGLTTGAIWAGVKCRPEQAERSTRERGGVRRIRGWVRGMVYAGDRWVSVGEGGIILTSGDGGGRWFGRSSGITSWLYGVAYDSERGRLVAVGEGGVVLKSTDAGATWDQVMVETDEWLADVYYGNNLWVAVGEDGGILTAGADGVEWALQRGDAQDDARGGDGDNERPLEAVRYQDGLWVVVGGEGLILTSRDGTEWTEIESPVAELLTDVSYGYRGERRQEGLWVAVGERGTIITSTDGQRWQERFSRTNARLNNVHYADGEWFAVGDRTRIITSTNGIEWRTLGGDGSDWLSVVEYGAGEWMAAGRDSAIYIRDETGMWVAR